MKFSMRAGVMMEVEGYSTLAVRNGKGTALSLSLVRVRTFVCGLSFECKLVIL